MNQPPYLSSETWISCGNPYGRMNMVIFWKLLGCLRRGYLFQEWDSGQNAAFDIMKVVKGKISKTSSMIHSTKVGKRKNPFKITISTAFFWRSIGFQVAPVPIFRISRSNWSSVQNMFAAWHDLELLLRNLSRHFWYVPTLLIQHSLIAMLKWSICARVQSPSYGASRLVGMVINLTVYYIHKDSLS